MSEKAKELVRKIRLLAKIRQRQALAAQAQKNQPKAEQQSSQSFTHAAEIPNENGLDSVPDNAELFRLLRAGGVITKVTLPDGRELKLPNR